MIALVNDSIERFTVADLNDCLMHHSAHQVALSTAKTQEAEAFQQVRNCKHVCLYCLIESNKPSVQYGRHFREDQVHGRSLATYVDGNDLSHRDTLAALYGIRVVHGMEEEWARRVRTKKISMNDKDLLLGQCAIAFPESANLSLFEDPTPRRQSKVSGMSTNVPSTNANCIPGDP